MKVGIIGCGAIGRKRALTLGIHQLVIAVDTSLERAKELSLLKPGAAISTDYHDALRNDEIDLVIISTTNEFLAKITRDAVQAGKHVLVEKPAGRNPEELSPIVKIARENGIFVKVGFNHRFHPAIQKAKHLVDSNAIGRLMYIRGRYGHGGRLGYDTEWRADAEKSGGGELIDQGIHLIDLSRWFLGDFNSVTGYAHTYFWNMQVDDNAFLMLKNADDQVAWLHVSCTEWKNLFSYEIYGEQGKLQIDGLGGSYGTERLSMYRMLPQMGPPETTIWEYPFPDSSWELEFNDFIHSIEQGKEPAGNINDAKEALEIVQAVYHQCDMLVNK
jgi:predicted dehydrogenase